jgi:hypothetical protein
MAKADPNAKWYRDQLARAAAKRAAARAARPPRRPALRDDPAVYRAYNAEWVRRAYYRKRYGIEAPPKGVGHVRPGPKARPKRTVEIVPIPSAPSGHPLYDEARSALKRWEAAELGGEMDSFAQDLLQTYVLARLEGCDPLEAIGAVRRRRNNDRKALVFGLPIVDGLER